MMRLSKSRICRVINWKRRTTRRCKSGDERAQMGCEGGAEGGGGEGRRGLQTGCQGAPRGRVQRVWRCRWGAWTFLSCWNASFLVQMPCITSCRQCGAHSQSGRGVGAAHRGQEPWHKGVEGGEAVGRETRGSNGDGESTEAQQKLPRSHQVMCAYGGVGAPESWPLGPRQFCGESSHCLGLVWLWRPWSACATQCWPLRHPSTWKLCALSSLGAVPRPVAPLVRAEKH